MKLIFFAAITLLGMQIQAATQTQVANAIRACLISEGERPLVQSFLKAYAQEGYSPTLVTINSKITWNQNQPILHLSVSDGILAGKHLYLDSTDKGMQLSYISSDSGVLITLKPGGHWSEVRLNGDLPVIDHRAESWMWTRVENEQSSQLSFNGEAYTNCLRNRLTPTVTGIKAVDAEKDAATADSGIVADQIIAHFDVNSVSVINQKAIELFDALALEARWSNGGFSARRLIKWGQLGAVRVMCDSHPQKACVLTWNSFVPGDIEVISNDPQQVFCTKEFKAESKDVLMTCSADRLMIHRK